MARNNKKSKNNNKKQSQTTAAAATNSPASTTKNTKKNKKKKQQETSYCDNNNNNCYFPSTLLQQDMKNNNQSSQQPLQLKVETLLPGYVWVIPNFSTFAECQRWIQYVENCGATTSGKLLEYTNQRATKYVASRRCYRMQKDDPQMSQRIYERLRRRVVPGLIQEIPPNPIGCNPNLRFYKYEIGHSFGKHYDGSNDILEMGGYTRLTALVYLSSCQGGATRFFDDHGHRALINTKGDGEIAFVPKAGSLLLHLHGDDCLLHQADPVTSGTKYVLRTDVVYPFST